MLDQGKVMSGERNPIMDLVNHEKSIKQIDVERPVKVQLAKDGKTLLLVSGGIELKGKVDRPIKHQLGGRAWGGNKDFEQIDTLWRKKFYTNPSELEQELAAVFRKNDLTIRYETNDQGENDIYGIVTPHFVDVNQLEFRQNFIEKTRQNTSLVAESQGITTSKYGNVIEWFLFDNPGFQTTFKYGLIYAKNNGYDAYKVNWQREVLVCTNGLTGWRGSKYRWKHTREIALNDFITGTVSEGIANQRFLERRINISLEKELERPLLAELMERLSLAKASKNRVQNRLDIEANDVGRNEWALSQALTWLGTHKSGIPFGSKPKLTALGTGILEKSLDKTLHDKARIDRRGMFGLLLPKELRRPVVA